MKIIVHYTTLCTIRRSSTEAIKFQLLRLHTIVYQLTDTKYFAMIFQKRNHRNKPIVENGSPSLHMSLNTIPTGYAKIDTWNDTRIPLFSFRTYGEKNKKEKKHKKQKRNPSRLLRNQILRNRNSLVVS